MTKDTNWQIYQYCGYHMKLQGNNADSESLQQIKTRILLPISCVLKCPLICRVDYFNETWEDCVFVQAIEVGAES